MMMLISTFNTPGFYQNGNNTFAPIFANMFAALGDSFNLASSIGNSDAILWLKLISLFLTGVMTIALIVLTLRVHAVLYPAGLGTTGVGSALSPTNPQASRRLYDKEWEQIKHFAASASPSEWKLSVIEGDKIVDDALKSAGFPGETMGERLTLIGPDQLPSVQSIWEAHKLRNLLVHDIRFTINHNQAIGAVANFERALRELEVLS